ncbi:hypothetical protein NLJ89_g6320 [Agrocybe chaxingu]|uniref:Uncharacterized protein n=1 Tax=Agrocybe chaxingu TaxID=84603 RepID=A0A9W8JZD7_9AGAR|nr:hypothetical protein NLJ89_g6320 [Agrocybe chaxingu]
MSTRQSDLHLNPGVQARRERMSFCRCLFWTCILAVVLANAYYIPNFMLGIKKGTREPHKTLYHKGDEKKADDVDVIRPLVDHQQPFDIMATIWLRTTKPNKDHAAPSEELIYSDRILRGLRLKDKDIHATIRYQIPTEIFKQENLTNYDLRASFILIPNTPSLLDFASNYSTWIPSHIVVPPVRPYEASRSLEDEIIDSFALTIPLLDFLNISSSCPEASHSGNAVKPTRIIGSEDEDEDEDDLPKPVAEKLTQKERKFLDPAVVYSTSDPSQVLELHPYVITRTFLRVVDMTKLYDRKEYNKFHRELKQKACPAQRNHTTSGLSWELCTRSFFHNGNMETRLKIRKPDPFGAAKKVQWAYAPYMSIAPFAWGPKDLIPIPVNRENCTRTKGSDREFVDVKWTINFAGRTHDKSHLADISGFAGITAKFNMTAPEDELKKVQFTIERMQGLHGHRFNRDVHPRRSFVFSLVGSFIYVVVKVLNAHYWYSLTSTIGISWPGVSLLALSGVLSTLSRAVTSDSNSSYLWIFLKLLPSLVTPWLMIKALLRLEFDWWGGGYVPTVKFMPPTHGEKVNQRLNDAASRQIALTMFFVVCAIYYFIQPEDVGVISPSANGSPKEPPSPSLIVQLLTPIIPAAYLVGMGMQLWFSHRSRIFAGRPFLRQIPEWESAILDIPDSR